MSQPKKVSFLVFFCMWARIQGWTVPALHVRICTWLDECDARVRVLMVFRGAAKSTIYAVWKAYCLYRDRSHRSIIWAADDKLAGKLTRDTINVLRRHPLCRGMLPRKPGAFSFWVTGATDARNPSMEACGASSNATGSRADAADFDDIEVSKNIKTPDARMNLRQKIEESTHILVPGWQKTFVGTPHTHDSIYTEQIEGGAAVLKIPLFEHMVRYETTDTKTRYRFPFQLGDDGLYVLAGIGKFARMMSEGIDYRIEGDEVVFHKPPRVVIDLCSMCSWPERFNRDEIELKRKENLTISTYDPDDAQATAAAGAAAASSSATAAAGSATAAAGSATAAAGSATAAASSATAAANSATQAANNAATVGFTLADLQSQGKTAVTSAGTAPNFTVTTDPAYGALTASQRMRVKFHAAGTTGSNTLNRDGLGAKNLKQYDNNGNKVPAVVSSGQLADVEYDGTDMVILNPLPAAALYAVEYLVIAGGGGGGFAEADYVRGGGGGAGGYRSSVSGESSGGGASAENVSVVAPGTAYTVTIGGGGAGGTAGAKQGTAGSSSVFGSVTAVGGGGASSYGNPGTSGGSGGGGSTGGSSSGLSGTSGQGFAGGNGMAYATSNSTSAGGGGGAGSVGANGSGGTGGNGGAGISSSITGSAVSRAGGGGGGGGSTGGTATAGGGNGGSGAAVGSSATANTGGGGGGASTGAGASYNGGNGGSGVVIVRYAGSQRGAGGTVTSSGGYTIHTFTSSGTFTA